MRDQKFDVIVIGAGAVGSSAAYHLSKRGIKTLLIEQFALGHDQGSSHGASRITRHAYVNPIYSELMPAAFGALRDLEGRAGVPLFLRTGGLYLGGPEYLDPLEKNLSAIHVPHRRMNRDETIKRFRAFKPLEGMGAIFEPDAGALAASRILEAEQTLAREQGAEIWEQCPVEELDAKPGRCAVRTPKGTVEAERVIVSAGVWTGKLLPRFESSLKPTRQQVLYFQPAVRADFEPGSFPVFIVHIGADSFYGMPHVHGMGVKVATENHQRSDPDSVKRTVDEEYVGTITNFNRAVIPALADAPVVRREVCVYTERENNEFLLGPLGSNSSVIVASCCSGHGFKFSVLVGKLAGEYAAGGVPSVPVEHWAKPLKAY